MGKRRQDQGRPAVNLARMPIYILLVGWALSEVMALVWMSYSSFKTTPEIYRSVWNLPSSLNFSSYYYDITGTAPRGVAPVPLGQFLVNSTIVAFSSVTGIILLAVPTGYALSKRSTSTIISFYFFLAMIAIPAPAILISVFYLVHSLGLYNTYLGLVLPYIATNIPFSVVLSRAFFRSFPKDLEEAARIDGLSEFGIFLRIVLPLSTVVVVLLAIVNFPNVWNELLYAIVIAPNHSVMTVQPGLQLFNGQFQDEWSQLFAGLVLTSLPMIIFYLFFQRYIIKAQFLGAIRG
jgi:raffinose/stachyose/melibiose transport system permease protein